MAQMVLDEIKDRTHVTRDEILPLIAQIKQEHLQVQSFDPPGLHRPILIKALRKYKDLRFTRDLYFKVDTVASHPSHTAELMTHVMERLDELEKISHGDIVRLMSELRYEYLQSDRHHYYHWHDPSLIDLFYKHNDDFILTLYKKSDIIRSRFDNTSAILKELVFQANQLEKFNEQALEELTKDYSAKWTAADPDAIDKQHIPKMVRQMYRHNKDFVLYIYGLANNNRIHDSHSDHMMEQVLHRLELMKDKKK